MVDWIGLLGALQLIPFVSVAAMLLLAIGSFRYARDVNHINLLPGRAASQQAGVGFCSEYVIKGASGMSQHLKTVLSQEATATVESKSESMTGAQPKESTSASTRSYAWGRTHAPYDWMDAHTPLDGVNAWH